MPRIVDKEAKKLQIIRAAIKVFARNGVVKTKMIEIAQEARIGKGTIYEYFKNKEEIFAEAFQLFFSETEKLMAEALQKTDHPVGKLKYLLHAATSGFFESSEDFVQIMMDFWAEGVRSNNEDVLKIINLNQIYDEYRKLISHILEEGIQKGMFKPMDTKLVASALIGSLDGLMLQWIMDKNVFQFREATDVLIDCFLHGIINKI